MVTTPVVSASALLRGSSAALSAAAAILVLLLAPVATAQAQGTQDAQAACTPDVFRLCSQYIPSRDPIVACLIRSRAALSPACRAVFKGPTRVAKAGKRVGKGRKVRRSKRVG